MRTERIEVFPFKVSRDALQRVMASMDLNRVCLVDLLEDASVVIAPKSQVKTSAWLRRRARRACLFTRCVRITRPSSCALQAMLGITGAGDGFDIGESQRKRERHSLESSADETDALDEVRMAVEQLVIPHREPVELLPRSGRIIEMQQALVESYSLNHTAIGEGQSDVCASSTSTNSKSLETQRYVRRANHARMRIENADDDPLLISIAR